MTLSRNFQLFKFLLFIGVITVLVLRLIRYDLSDWILFEINVIPVFIALMLVPLNWYMEFLKWKGSIDTIGVTFNKEQLKQSFFAGIVTGMLTPNMLGNFIGRMFYFQRKDRVQITLFTLLSNFAQFLPSIFFGILALWLTGDRIFADYQLILIIIFIVTFCISVIIYFNVEILLKVFRKRKSYTVEFRNSLKKSGGIRIKLVVFSVFRHVIFSFQFALILISFGASFSADLLLNIWLVYLITTMIPSLFLGKLGIRESVALLVLSSLGLNDLIILTSSLLIWITNLLLPSVLGLIVCKNRIPS